MVEEANYLSRTAGEVTVLATSPCRRHPALDRSLVKFVSPDVHVVRTFAGLLHHLRYHFPGVLLASEHHDPSNGSPGSRLYLRFLAHIVFPCSTAEWIPWALGSCVRLFRSSRFDVVYSYGEPFPAHLVAYAVHRWLAIPWVMYISDPRYFSSTSVNKRLLRWLESVCLAAADRIIVNCEETLEGYVHHFGVARPKFTVIPDGFEDSLYRETEPEASGKFRLLFTGRFYEDHDEPECFLRAIRTLSLPEVEVLFAGPVSPAYLERLRRLGLAGGASFLGMQPLERVVALQKGASVLVSFGRQGGYQLPKKVLEYFAARRPVLVVSSDPRDVSSKYVLRYKRGLAVASRSDEVAMAVQDLFALWKRGQLERAFDLREPEQFRGTRLAASLASVLSDACLHPQGCA